MTNEIVLSNSQQVAIGIDRVKVLAAIMWELRDQVLKENIDYGVIPGTGDKPTLLLPGMEKIMRSLNAVPAYIEREIIRDFAAPLFLYEYECELRDADTGIKIPGGNGIGLCTSMESAFRWRWVAEHDLPYGLETTGLLKRSGKVSEFTFAVDEAKTTGDYSKPAEYWQRFRDAIAAGTATSIKRKTKAGKELPAWEIGGMLYRIPNPDVADQMNAICKRAQKRSLASAVKGAASVSEYFTVDLDDSRPVVSEDVIDGSYTVEPPLDNGDLPLRNQPPGNQSTQGNPSPRQDKGGWIRTGDGFKNLLAWASKSFNLSIEEILEAMQLLEPELKTIPATTYANIDVMGAITAFGSGFDEKRISDFTSVVPGMSDDSRTKLDRIAQKIAADQRALWDIDPDEPKVENPSQSVRGAVYERVVYLFPEVEERNRAGHYAGLWGKLEKAETINDSMSVDEIVEAFKTYYMQKANDAVFENLPSAPPPAARPATRGRQSSAK